MTRMMQAELFKLARPHILLAAGAVILIASVAVTTIVFTGADPADDRGFSRFPTINALEAAGGGTEAFSFAVSFMGFFVFVILTANWAAEFSHGTFRSLLLQNPRRQALLMGKLLGLLATIAAVLAVAALVAWLASLVFASSSGLSTNAWFDPGALVTNTGDYLRAFAVVAAWACYGMMLGILVRSMPLALGIGIAWAGPFEHILQNTWGEVSGWFPGLLLEALAAGGTPEASTERALLLTTAYAAMALSVSALVLRRRDMMG